MLIADRWPMRARSSVCTAFARAVMIGTLGAGVAQATTIGPLRPDGPGEILEPSALRPVAPPATGDKKVGVPPGVRSLPKPSFDVYEKLGAAIDRATSGPHAIRRYRPSAEGFSGLNEKLTALEWIELWSENGYWLENNQWTDFQAIALASYLPDLHYWLGRDRWAAFGASAFGVGMNTGFAESPDAGKHGSNGVGRPALGGYSTGPENFFSGNGSHARPKPKTEPRTLGELLILMAGKISRQPLFYLGIAGLLFILTLAFRRQSKQPLATGFAQKTGRTRRLRRRKKAAPKGAA